VRELKYYRGLIQVFSDMQDKA